MIFPPDSFPRDWYQWLTNQAGHSVLVGVPAGLALMPFLGPYIAPLAVFTIYLVFWEWGKQRFGAGLADAMEDSACVMAGASLICGYEVGYWTAWGAFAVWCLFLAWGVWKRA